MKNCSFITFLSTILVILSALTLTGCGRQAQDIQAAPDEPGMAEHSPAPFSHAAPQKNPEALDYAFPETAPFIDDTGKSMQRDGNFLYSYYNGRLIRFDQETEELTLLYQTASTHDLSFCLYKNYIYFVERTGCDSLDDRDTSLWCMGKDGTDLTLLQDDIINAHTLRDGKNYSIDIYDNIIYLINYTSDYEDGTYVTKTANLYYRLENDGTATEIEEAKTLYGTLPRRFSPVYDTDFPTFPYAMRHYGYLFVQDSGNTLYRLKPDGGEKESLGLSTKGSSKFTFSGDLIFLYPYYGDSVPSLFHLSDKTHTSLDGAPAKISSGLTAYTSDQGFYFCCNLLKEDSFLEEPNYRLQIFRVEPDGSTDALISDSSLYFEDTYGMQLRNNSCVLGDHFYYYENNETTRRLMRLSLSEYTAPEEVSVFSRYPASSPAAVIVEEREDNTQIEGNVSVYRSLKKLFLEENTEADRRINQTLTELYTDFETSLEELIQQEKKQLEEDPSFYESYDFGYTSGYDFSLQVSLDYMDDETISFCCDYYQYYPYAAHGYYWSDYYVFDRQSGERLSFEYFAGDSASILAIASPYVEKMAEWEFEPEILLDISRFSLSEDGYTLYFAPYEIGCYASGSYLITIPYEAFEEEL